MFRGHTVIAKIGSSSQPFMCTRTVDVFFLFSPSRKFGIQGISSSGTSMGVLSGEAIFPNQWVCVGIDLHFSLRT